MCYREFDITCILRDSENGDMANDAKKTYRLYVLPMDADGLRTAGKERFYRVTPGYVLIYTDAEISGKHAEMTQNELHRLSHGDSEWLRDCNIVLVAEEMRAHEREIAESMSKRLDAMEAALKAEAEKEQNENREG